MIPAIGKERAVGSMAILDTIHSREDLLRLDKAQTTELCAQLREKLIQTISQTGGHLSSNLGVVELTVALHKVFDTAVDRLVFDVGHQCYAHKLLTGRAAQFDSLASLAGCAAFPIRPRVFTMRPLPGMPPTRSP